MAYAKINSIANAAMAKVNSSAKAALGKISSVDAPSASFANTYSLAFDASNDHVVIGATSLDAYTISIWFKGTAINRKLYAKGAGKSHVYFRNGSGTTRAAWVQHSATAAQLFDIEETDDVLDGNWHHLVVAISGGSNQTSTMKVYINANLEYTYSTETGTYTADTANLMLGATWDGYGIWNGNIDEVGIWQNHVLTASEVTALYNSGTPINLQADSGNYASSGDLTHWWRMGDGDTYPTITDNEGSEDGTMTNMTSGDLVADVPGGD